jgi:hypothetical protein
MSPHRLHGCAQRKPDSTGCLPPRTTASLPLVWAERAACCTGCAVGHTVKVTTRAIPTATSSATQLLTLSQTAQPHLLQSCCHSRYELLHAAIQKHPDQTLAWICEHLARDRDAGGHCCILLLTNPAPQPPPIRPFAGSATRSERRSCRLEEACRRMLSHCMMAHVVCPMRRGVASGRCWQHAPRGVAEWIP